MPHGRSESGGGSCLATEPICRAVPCPSSGAHTGTGRPSGEDDHGNHQCLAEDDDNYSGTEDKRKTDTLSENMPENKYCFSYE